MAFELGETAPELDEDRELFNQWFTGLVFTCESCVLRDVLRETRSQLWEEWLRQDPYGFNEEIKNDK